jgi:penicillin-binding protein 2
MKRPGRNWKQFGRRALYAFLLCFFLTLIFAIILLRPYYLRAKEFDLTKLGDFDVSTLFFDRHGDEIGRLFVEDRTLLTHDEIPDLVRHAVISVEDKNFYSHHGIDFKGIARALWTNLKYGTTRQGGSTITQQLAKHLIGNFDRTFDRKLVEAFLALRIERHYNKDQILDFYLNRIYFGKGYFGLASAARGYFGKKAEEVTIPEAALLAGIIKSPTSRSPRNNLEKSKEWRNYALNRMCSEGYISEEEAKVGAKASVKLVVQKENTYRGGIRSYFMALASKELEEILGREGNSSLPQGLRVYTTLDLQLQKSLESETLKQIQEFEHKVQNENISASNPLQPGIVAMDVSTGAIRSLIGGRNFQTSPFDRATMARRENGEILFPLIYALAFERTPLHPASLVNATYLDTQLDESKRDYSLGNPDIDFEKRFLTIQDSLAFANKSCALRVLHQLKENAFADWLVKNGFLRAPVSKMDDNGMPMTSLLEAVSCYEALANQGSFQRPYTIEYVQNSRDDILYKAQISQQIRVNPLIAQQMTLTMQSALTEGNYRDLICSFHFSNPLAGMSGFSEGYRDAWFVGYDPTYALGVWLGCDQPTPIGDRMISTRAVVPLWGKLMNIVQSNEHEEKSFSVPNDLVKVEIDRESGAIQGLGFLTPSPGNIFVYLKRAQTTSIASNKVSNHLESSDWLSTVTKQADKPILIGDIPDTTDSTIPKVAEYRIPALRGKILGRDGRPFALTVESQDLVLSWPSLEIANNEMAVLSWVKNKLHIASQWIGNEINQSDRDILDQYHHLRFQPILVVQNLSQDFINAFPNSELAAQGFSLQGVPKRLYPNHKLFAHGIGFLKRTQTSGQKRYLADQIVYDDYAGFYGLEGVFDQDLKGKEGKITIVTNNEGFSKKVSVESQATEGLSVQTTIDPYIQSVVENALRSSDDVRAGAMVILDPNTGDVLAMASVPDFDPNQFLPGLSLAEWKEIAEARKSPLLNRAYQERNPPGSTFKVITSIASMKAGVFDPQRVVHCPGFFQVANITFNFPNETQDVSYRSALARSCNTYFMDLGLRTGRDFLIQTARDFGIGQPTGIILPNEERGLMPDPQLVRAIHHRNMGLGDVANSSIGQGDVLVTPLQAANVMAAVANGGILFRPRLVTQLLDSKGVVQKSFPIQILHTIALPREVDLLKDAMQAVVEEGTAMSAQVPGISIAAKTGTAQVGSKSTPRQIAWVEGYLPADKPRYAFAIMIEGDVDQDLHGGTSAGPIIAQIFAKTLSKPVLTAAE